MPVTEHAEKRKGRRLSTMEPVEFRSILKLMDLDNAEAAELLGLSLRSIYHIKAGKQRVTQTLANYLRVIRRLKVKPKDILSMMQTW